MRKLTAPLAALWSPPKKADDPAAVAQQRKRSDEEALAASASDDLARSLTRAMGGGLLARGLGGLAAAGLRAAGGQLRAAADASRDAHARAADLVQRDAAVAAALGGGPVSCSAPTAVSSSSLNINGVASSQTVVEFLVTGRGTGAVATARATADGGGRTDVVVALPSGRVVKVVEGGGGRVGGPSGDVIDVEVVDSGDRGGRGRRR